MKKHFFTSHGSPHPLGATIQDGGVNFSVFAPFAERVVLLLFDDENDTRPATIELDHKINKSYYYWHIYVHGIGVNQCYGYRVYGPYEPRNGHRYDGSKVLTDPYSKMIVGHGDRYLAACYGENNVKSCFKSVVIDNTFDWEGVESPLFTPNEAVIYEAHVKGFTYHPNSGVEESIRGTFRGFLEKLDHLKELGINTIELMPIFKFDAQDAPHGLTNYWGYSPLNFFSLHNAYSSEKEPQKIINDFKEFVKTLHKNGFKIVLDVVYNHTTENRLEDGPTYNFRGFSNKSYYIADDDGNYKDYSGCGNTLNANHSVVRRMIRDSLRYWVEEMHIDGFRFDLASVLTRDENGNPMENPPVIWSIDSEPILANTWMIAEPWDAAGLYNANNFAGDKWLVWRNNFRDTIRNFIKTTPNFGKKAGNLIAATQPNAKGRYFRYLPKRNINFITAHDGFTLWDLVSYQNKHNLENREFNRDGSNENLSWNCGFEGETNDEKILQLRLKQCKNFMAALFLSHGIPMMLMGDEILRTQKGNNNPYCQDNEVSWMNWEYKTLNHNFFDWCKNLLKFRHQHKIFSYHDYFSDKVQKKHPFFVFHDTILREDVKDYILSLELVDISQNERILMVFNTHWESQNIKIQKDTWSLLMTSALVAPIQSEIDGGNLIAEERSFYLFVGNNLNPYQ